jgi:hypothetical protein
VAESSGARPLQCPICESTSIFEIIAYGAPALECADCRHWGTLTWGFAQPNPRPKAWRRYLRWWGIEPFPNRSGFRYAFLRGFRVGAAFTLPILVAAALYALYSVLSHAH